MALTPAQIFAALVEGWQNGHVRMFGDDGLETANDAANYAALARLVTETDVRDGEGRLARICAGEHVLVWFRGRAPATGERMYVGWHPSRGVLNLFSAPASSLEIIPHQER